MIINTHAFSLELEYLGIGTLRPNRSSESVFRRAGRGGTEQGGGGGEQKE